jgi:hypothetical protein
VSAGEVLAAGVAPHHRAALVAGLLAALACAAGARRLVHRLRATGRPHHRLLPDAVTVALLAVAGAVHLALPLGHGGDAVLAAAFVGSGAAYAWLALRVVRGQRWRTATAGLLALTLAGYLAALAGGRERPDQVGLLTALVELVLLGLALAPVPGSARSRGPLPALATAAVVTSVLLVGSGAWAAAYAPGGTGHDHGPGPGPGHDHGGAGHPHHGGPSSGQALAGMIDLTVQRAATPADRRAADELAAATKASLARFGDIRAALAAGYRPTLARTGYGVHLEHRDAARDEAVLDPRHPELLMYAIADGRATLLSAVHTLPRATDPLPATGGPLLPWHTHNGCATLVPPGLGIVDPFGGCPPTGVQATLAPMLHVWVVDPPGGPFAHDVEQAWLAAYHRTHGIPFDW